MGYLQDNCPRLALAVAQYNMVVREREARRQRKIAQVHRLEGLVAHRDLQLVRASATGRLGRRGQAKYIHERSVKLTASQRALAHVRTDLATVSTWEPGWAR